MKRALIAVAIAVAACSDGRIDTKDTLNDEGSRSVGTFGGRGGGGGSESTPAPNPNTGGGGSIDTNPGGAFQDGGIVTTPPGPAPTSTSIPIPTPPQVPNPAGFDAGG